MNINAAHLSWEDRSLYFDVVVTETQEERSQITDHPVETGATVTDHVRAMPDRVVLEVFVSNAPISPNGLANADGAILGGAATMARQSVDLNVGTFGQGLSYSPPFAPTPGAVFQAAGNALNQVAKAIGLTKGPVTRATPYVFPADFNFVRETWSILHDLKKKATVLDVFTSTATYGSMVIEELSAVKDFDAGTGGRMTIGLRSLSFVDTALTVAPVSAIPRGQPPKAKGVQAPETPVEQKSLAAKALDAQ